MGRDKAACVFYACTPLKVGEANIAPESKEADSQSYYSQREQAYRQPK